MMEILIKDPYSTILMVIGVLESLMPLALGLFVMVVLKYFGENSGATAETVSGALDSSDQI